MTAALVFALGLAVGGAAVYIVMRRRMARVDGRLTECRVRLYRTEKRLDAAADRTPPV